jgi:hypothetical protein
MTIVLAVLLSLLALASFVWLVIVAFKQHVGWGLAVFFLSPIASLVFAIMHWAKAKVPFLVNVGSNILLVIVIYNIFVGFAQQQVEGFKNDPAMQAYYQKLLEQRQKNEITDEELKQAMLTAMFKKSFKLDVNDDVVKPAMDEDKQPEPMDEPQPVEEEQPAQQVIQRKKAYLPLSLSDVSGHIGDPMKIYSNDGNVRSGTFERSDEGSLYFQQRVYNGTLSFEVRKKDIRRLEVLGYREY